MRIVLGDRSISLNWLPVLLFVILVLYPMEIGHTFFHGPPDPNNPEEGPRKIISGIALLYTLARFRRLPPFLRNLFFLVFGYIFIISLESFYKYGTFFVYPHVFGKFFVVFACTAMYVAFRGAKEWAYTAALVIMSFMFIFDVVVHYPHVLSIGSFMDIDRGLHATTVMFLMCACLYAFNSYLPTLKPQWLVYFFVLIALILFLNHRTVWLATITTFGTSLLITNIKGRENYSPTAWTPIIVIPLIAVVLVFAYVFSEKPELLQNIVDRVLDIEKVNERGTGKWRLEQFQSYLPYVLDHPFFGMRFEGFELPVQFFAEQTNEEVFAADTGHHFHSFYMDSLFYHGLLGLGLLGSVYVYVFYKMVTLPVRPPMRLIGLGTWCIFCLQYGLSYPLDDYHFAMAGFTLAAIDTFLDKIDAERAAHPELAEVLEEEEEPEALQPALT